MKTNLFGRPRAHQPLSLGILTHPEGTSVDEFEFPSGFNHITSGKVSCGGALGKMQFSFYCAAWPYCNDILLVKLQHTSESL